MRKTEEQALGMDCGRTAENNAVTYKRRKWMRIGYVKDTDTRKSCKRSTQDEFRFGTYIF
jgi:hypothetical protein